MTIRKVAVLLLTLAASPLIAGEFSGPQGFSFAFPEGWIALSEQDRQNMGLAENELVQRAKIDLTLIAVLVVQPGNDDFCPSFNVVVNSPETPINEKAKDEILSIVSTKLRSVGMTVIEPTAEIRKIGANSVIVMDYRSRIPAMPFELRQRQVFFTGGGKNFIVTCSAKMAEFDAVSPAFDSMLASFKVPPPTVSSAPFGGFGLKDTLISSAICGVIGVAVGGCIAAFNLLLKKRKSD